MNEGQWHRKTFYGVTIGDQDWDARDIQSGIAEEQQFDARYFIPASGSGAPPAIGGTLPYHVQYTDANGSYLLYTYDPTTNQFTAQASTAGCATIGYNNGAFAIQFAGASQAVVCTSGTPSPAYQNPTAYRNANAFRQMMLVVNGGVFVGAPIPANLPRLDFYYGSERIFTVTQQGIHDLDFEEGSVTSVPGGGFGILSNGTLVATAVQGSLTASQYLVNG